ncbi:hypothetical protein NIES2135_20680 [Leptolyngbya boryana NIES-2135]|jgi:hypothetical protein|uniref:Uncharacterized protein n=1 Tax=Leptolyngbya boryana NIES-2135 TaxID=1973484 RepID=A0A1Z4JEN5_LEPBY|nr:MULTISPECIES: hypothetical protein [Leptolyngbya]BAY55245.1 hypothetical protein NIES2135_20680 [Leptolyngbya boryana NIES-2135]MBD2369330.1 hypothetical protein [Leptolyngbya sp. FACHB-161]MBD2375668.1 hypothetical protein [Leptolyngbya sp. FACHB-238]MBD2401659.1 hypothetical protein [Leptolyngbya sp. FACHB-239]MBD2406602.1 hypothetical protein [Leptolyngbya sp. FACHB-402]
MAIVKDLRLQAKARKIKGWSRMNKAQLMSALGVTEQPVKKSASLGDARARATAKKSGFAKSYAAQKLAEKLGGEHHKEAIVKTISIALKNAERLKRSKLTPEEKRDAAVSAIKSYAQKQRNQAKAEAKGESRTDVLRAKYGDSTNQAVLQRYREMSPAQRRKHEGLIDNLERGASIDHDARTTGSNYIGAAGLRGERPKSSAQKSLDRYRAKKRNRAMSPEEKRTRRQSRRENRKEGRALDGFRF